MTQVCKIVRPESLQELRNCLGGQGPVRLLAGGTDFLVRHREVLLGDCSVVDCTAVPELRGIALDEQTGELRVGAAATFTEIGQHAVVAQHAPALAEAATGVGSVQIRNRATLGGNVANASPAADSLPALACLDAVAVVSDSEGKFERRPVPELIGGFETNALSADEFILEFRIPLTPGRLSGFQKLGSREHVSISRINLAVSLAVREDGFSNLVAWVGTLGPRPAVISLEDAWSAENWDEIADILKGKLAALVDERIAGRYSQTYKRSALQGLGEDLLARLAGTVACTKKGAAR